NCTLSANSAGLGGAIYNRGTLMIVGSTLSGNSSPGSGGAINNDTTLTVRGCTLSGNSAGYDGGAIISGGAGTLTVSDSTLSHNSARRHGGAIWVSGTATITRATVSDNMAGTGTVSNEDGGGGIWQLGGTLNLSGCTLSRNSGYAGGGINLESGTL